mmetsp:Transcript_20404/g.28675  ORF Transcript_20404/g.28675 Transcript_20404/m.28675 type:complete len:211 (-) Transcript_20404:481-1113(-)
MIRTRSLTTRSSTPQNFTNSSTPTANLSTTQMSTLLFLLVLACDQPKTAASFMTTITNLSRVSAGTATPQTLLLTVPKSSQTTLPLGSCLFQHVSPPRTCLTHTTPVRSANFSRLTAKKCTVYVCPRNSWPSTRILRTANIPSLNWTSTVCTMPHTATQQLTPTSTSPFRKSCTVLTILIKMPNSGSRLLLLAMARRSLMAVSTPTQANI